MCYSELNQAIFASELTTAKTCFIGSKTTGMIGIIKAARWPIIFIAFGPVTTLNGMAIDFAIHPAGNFARILHPLGGIAGHIKDTLVRRTVRAFAT